MVGPRMLFAGALVALAAACSGPAPSGTTLPTTAPVPSASAPQLREEGDARARRGEYSTAAARYRSALQLEPDDLLLHFALGSALSYLDREEETIEQFRWVVDHGAPGRPEVATARQWLAAVGPPTEAEPPSRRLPERSPADRGAVRGNTSWPGVNPQDRRVTLELRIAGDSRETAQTKMRIRSLLGRPYTFLGLPPGPYRLAVRSGTTALWESRVMIDPGRDTVLDLSEANSLIKSADFVPQAG